MSDHLETARTYLAIAESSDAKREAYIRAADEIIAWLAEDRTRSQRQVAKAIGKSKSWVQEFVQWGTSDRGPGLPFGRSYDHKSETTARRILREQPEIIEEVLAEGGEAALAISRAVHKRDWAEKEEQAEERRKHEELTAPALPFYARTLLEQMRKMERAMAGITEDDLLMLAELPGIDDLIEASERLQMQVARWQLQLGGRIAIDQDGTITIEVD